MGKTIGPTFFSLAYVPSSLQHSPLSERGCTLTLALNADSEATRDRWATGLSEITGVAVVHEQPAEVGNDEGNECTICFEAMCEHGEGVEAGRALQCGHRFHLGCIFEWLD